MRSDRRVPSRVQSRVGPGQHVWPIPSLGRERPHDLSDNPAHKER